MYLGVKMLESTHFIEPYCCVTFKQLYLGLFIMMGDSFLLSIYLAYCTLPDDVS